MKSLEIQIEDSGKSKLISNDLTQLEVLIILQTMVKSILSQMEKNNIIIARGGDILNAG